MISAKRAATLAAGFDAFSCGGVSAAAAPLAPRAVIAVDFRLARVHGRGGRFAAALPSIQLIQGLAVAPRAAYIRREQQRSRWAADRRRGDDAAGRRAHAQAHGDFRMARKRATVGEFDLFDVVYEDGTQRSNRRVPSAILGGLDGDAPARAVIEEQDRLIAEKSGKPAVPVKSIRRSGVKERQPTADDEAARQRPAASRK